MKRRRRGLKQEKRHSEQKCDVTEDSKVSQICLSEFENYIAPFTSDILKVQIPSLSRAQHCPRFGALTSRDPVNPSNRSPMEGGNGVHLSRVVKSKLDVKSAAEKIFLGGVMTISNVQDRESTNSAYKTDADVSPDHLNSLCSLADCQIGSESKLSSIPAARVDLLADGKSQIYANICCSIYEQDRKCLHLPQEDTGVYRFNAYTGPMQHVTLAQSPIIRGILLDDSEDSAKDFLDARDLLEGTDRVPLLSNCLSKSCCFNIVLSADAFKEPSQAFVEGFERLLEMKYGIMALRVRHGLDAWSLAAQMVNPFEILPFVVATPVLNRAYFKMWELIQSFGLVPSVSELPQFFSAHLCEGPGGFIEAVVNSRATGAASAKQNGVTQMQQVSGNWLSLEEGAAWGENTISISKATLDSSARALGDPNWCKSSNKDLESIEFVSDMHGSPTQLDIVQQVNHGQGQDSQLKVVIDHSEASTTMRLSLSGKEHYDAVLAPNLQCTESWSKLPEDNWFALTLAPTEQLPGRDSNGRLPPVIETNRLTLKMPGIAKGHVHFGMDNSGDITNPANVQAFIDYTLKCCEGQKMHLITADGAFDVSDDFSSQEQSHMQLVFCELLTALKLQAVGGSLVLKLFDCHTRSTVTILYIISSFYMKLEIVRLRTTRVCNSERYVVAQGFVGLTHEMEKHLEVLNSEWKEASLRGEKVGVMYTGKFPDELLSAILKSNTSITTVQVDGINRALQLAAAIGERLPFSDSFGRRKGVVSMLRRKLVCLERLQTNAIALCTALQIPWRKVEMNHPS